MTDLALPDVLTPLSLLSDLEGAGAITATGLELPADLSFDRYAALLAAFGHVEDRCRYYIGDLINWGEKAYPDRYEQAVAITGLRSGTLMWIASVCGRVARSRRRPELSFGHHAAVAKLDPQEQTEWLSAAVHNGWTRSELREKLKGADVLPPPPEQPQWTQTNGADPFTSQTVRVLAYAKEGGLPIFDRVLTGPELAAKLPAISAKVVEDGVLPAPPVVLAAPSIDEESELRASVRRLREAATTDATGATYLVPRDPFDEAVALAGEE